MVDDDGTPVTHVQVLDRVHAIGAILVRRGSVEGLDFATWRRGLRRAAKTPGFCIAVNQLGNRAAVISNPDHVLTYKQRRAAVEGMALPPGLPQPQPPGLRLVADSAPQASPARRQRPPRLTARPLGRCRARLRPRAIIGGLSATLEGLDVSVLSAQQAHTLDLTRQLLQQHGGHIGS